MRLAGQGDLYVRGDSELPGLLGVVTTGRRVLNKGDGSGGFPGPSGLQ